MLRESIATLTIVLLGWLGSILEAAAATPDVTVLASQTLRQDGSARYQYRLVNKSERAVVGLIIGSDYYHGVSELDTYPLGWSAENPIPAGNASSPLGWHATVVTTEESPLVELEWRNDGHADIQPGQTQEGFAIVLARPNARYLTSHWTAIFSNGTAQSAQLLALAKPRISIKVTGAHLLAQEQWNVTLRLTNEGEGIASQVRFQQVGLRTLSGTGQVTLASALPDIGDVTPGSSIEFALKLNVPASVRKVALTETGTLDTSGGSSVGFSSAQVFYPKH